MATWNLFVKWSTRLHKKIVGLRMHDFAFFHSYFPVAFAGSQTFKSLMMMMKDVILMSGILRIAVMIVLHNNSKQNLKT